MSSHDEGASSAISTCAQEFDAQVSTRSLNEILLWYLHFDYTHEPADPELMWRDINTYTISAWIHIGQNMAKAHHSCFPGILKACHDLNIEYTAVRQRLVRLSHRVCMLRSELNSYRVFIRSEARLLVAKLYTDLGLLHSLPSLTKLTDDRKTALVARITAYLSIVIKPALFGNDGHSCAISLDDQRQQIEIRQAWENIHNKCSMPPFMEYLRAQRAFDNGSVKVEDAWIDHGQNPAPSVNNSAYRSSSEETTREPLAVTGCSQRLQHGLQDRMMFISDVPVDRTQKLEYSIPRDITSSHISVTSSTDSSLKSNGQASQAGCSDTESQQLRYDKVGPLIEVSKSTPLCAWLRKVPKDFLGCCISTSADRNMDPISYDTAAFEKSIPDISKGGLKAGRSKPLPARISNQSWLICRNGKLVKRHQQAPTPPLTQEPTVPQIGIEPLGFGSEGKLNYGESSEVTSSTNQGEVDSLAPSEILSYTDVAIEEAFPMSIVGRGIPTLIKNRPRYQQDIDLQERQILLNRVERGAPLSVMCSQGLGSAPAARQAAGVGICTIRVVGQDSEDAGLEETDADVHQQNDSSEDDADRFSISSSLRNDVQSWSVFTRGGK